MAGAYGNAYYGEGNFVDPVEGGEDDVLRMMSHYYNSAYPANAAFWQQGSIDKRFKAGDQSLWSMIYGDNQYYQSRRYFFNLIRRLCNMMCGYQRRNRKSTITMPLNDTDKLADDYNKVLKWCEDRDNFQEYLSQTFEGAVDTGCSLLHMYLDYTRDPVSGDLCTDQVSYNNFLIDPYWRKLDFSDCNFIWRRRWVSKNVAKNLLPDKAEEIDKLRPSGAKDGKFPLQAELLNLDTNKLFSYDEFHYRSSRKATMIIDPMTGESEEWQPDDQDPENMLEVMLASQPWLKVKEVEVPTVKLAIVIAGKLLYQGKNLLGIDEYPFVPVVTYHEPDIQSYQWKIQGVIRNLRDAQYLFNSRVVIMEDVLRSQINSGWIYPVDAVTDPKAFRQTGQGFLIPLKAGHLPGEIQRIDPPAIPQSMMELATMLGDLINQISGVNEELLGSATDDKSGILSMLRQGAGLTTLQTMFDKLDISQRIYGKLRLKAIVKNFSKGKVEQILGREVDPRFFSSYSLKYSVAVEEGNYSTTQRQMELQQLLHFREIGMPISDKSILKAAFITNKEEVIAEMEEQMQQQQQAQQAQAQQQEKMDNSKIMQAYAKSKSDMASAQEKMANIANIQASTEHKEIESDLNLVKLAMELEDVQFNQIKQAFELAQTLKLANQSQNQEIANVGGLI